MSKACGGCAKVGVLEACEGCTRHWGCGCKAMEVYEGFGGCARGWGICTRHVGPVWLMNIGRVGAYYFITVSDSCQVLQGVGGC